MDKLKSEAMNWLQSQKITSDNIGEIRGKLLMPFDCEWNDFVRTFTADLENK